MKKWLLVVLLLASACPSIADEPKDKTELILKQLTEIQKTVDKMNRDLETRATKSEADIAKLREDLDALAKKRPETKVSLPPTVPFISDTPTKLEEEFAKIQEKVDFLLKQSKTNEEAAKKIPPTVPFVTKEAPKVEAFGIVILKNSWVAPANVVIGDKVYKVLPGTSQTVYVPPGALRYNVWEVHGNIPQDRTIGSGETLIIDILHTFLSLNQSPQKGGYSHDP